MSDTTPTIDFPPGTNAYAGIRADTRLKTLTSTLVRTKKTRGETADLAALAKMLHAVIHEYDKSEQATSSIVGEFESLFGSVIARLNEIGDEREAGK